MRATERLHCLGQSLWLDNITRDLLTSGTLQRYINDLSVTGLTSNPSIFDNAIARSASYDAEIRRLTKAGTSGEALFFELAIEDLTKAADMFAPIHQRTACVDGWVSLEVSPLLAHDTAKTVAAAKSLHAKAARPNLFIKIPGTLEGLPAIEEAIFAGVPINVTLLFSRDDYMRAADAYMSGLERRVVAGLSPDVRSVASVFVSRWDKATARPARHRGFPAELQGVSRPARFGALAAAGGAGCAPAAAAVRKHQHEGPAGLRCAVYGRARGAQHGQYRAGGDTAGVRQSWRGRRGNAPGRRRL
jgi:transaldolase